MQRLLAAVCAFALLMTLAVRADEAKDKEKKAETPKEMFQELRLKYQKAKKQEDIDELLKTYSEKFIAYAEKNKDEKGAEALFYVLQLPGKDAKNSPRLKALAMLTKDHAKTTKIGKTLKKLPAGPDDASARTLLLDIAENNKDKPTRAYAYRSLIKQSEMAASFAERVKEDEKLRENVEKANGKDLVKCVLDLAAASEKDIKAYRAKLEGDLKGSILDLSVGKAAPEVNTLDIDGKKVKLSDLKGKVVVLDFWATWCGPCKSMIPHTRELVKKMDGKPFVFVSISADEEKQTLEDFLKKTPMPWTHWYSGMGGVVEDWDIEGYPTIFILDAKGVIRKKIEEADSKAIDAEVEKLVKQAEADKK